MDEPKRRPDRAHSRVPPHDLEAEKAALGAALLSADAAEVVATLAPGAYYAPAHQYVATAVRHLVKRGDPVDHVTVAGEMTNAGTLEQAGGIEFVAELMNAVPAVSAVSHYVDRISNQKARRDLLLLAAYITDNAYAEPDARVAWNEAIALVGTNPLDAGADPIAAIPLVEFLTSNDTSEAEWVLADLLARGDRMILTGAEGVGKMVLLRQLGMLAAAGLHPWTQEPAEPVRVVLVDCENPHKEINRWLMRAILALPELPAGFDPTEMFHVVHRPQGLALHDLEDTLGHRAEILRELDRVQPDLVIIGPLYKIHIGGDPNAEKEMAPLAGFLDLIRTRYDAAILIEGHTPHGTGTGSSNERPERPNGWSGWMRWPEFGYYLDKYHGLKSWRGNRSDRRLPTRLGRGDNVDGAWPWHVEEWPTEKTEDWRPTVLMEKAWRFIHDNPGTSRQKIVKAVGSNEANTGTALDYLEQDGFVKRNKLGPGKATEHHTTQPYPPTSATSATPPPHLPLE